MNEGAIKFNCRMIKRKIKKKEIKDLNKWRNKLFELNLIGVYSNGIGFGNISKRTEKNKFIITGSATGRKKKLNEKDYCKVIKFDLKKNSLICEGQTKPSSESLTHASVYKTLKEANAVIHIHNLQLWNHLLEKIPATSKKAKYGSLQLTKEITSLLKEKKTKKIILMKGHKEGIISFGKNLDETGKILLKYTEEIK